jgi:hypothetical protein
MQLTVVIPVTFQPGFAGAKQIYKRAANMQQLDSGWHILESWTVP